MTPSVVKNTEVGGFVDQPIDIFFGIGGFDAQQDQKTLIYLSDNLTIDSDGCFTYTLNDYSPT